MNCSPKVSIIIPCYNHGTYIAQALTSAFIDTYSNKEILVIDDGSKDNSIAVIERWIEEHLGADIHFHARSNKGLCHTLNQLIGLSTGDYILVLASDDVLIGDTIGERIRLLVEQESKGKFVIVSDSIAIDENGTELYGSTMTEYNRGDKQKYKTDLGILRETVVNPSISGAVVIINKKIFDIIGLYPTDLHAEDWFFYQRAAAINSIIFYDIKVSFYRLHDFNTSGRGASNLQKAKLYSSIVKIYFRNISWFKIKNIRFLAILQLIKYGILLFLVKVKVNVKKN